MDGILSARGNQLVHVSRNHNPAADRASAANGINETTKRARKLALIAPRAATRRRRSRPEVGAARSHRSIARSYPGWRGAIETTSRACARAYALRMPKSVLAGGEGVARMPGTPVHVGLIDSQRRR
jgi:hypothetical protein